jgi:hypothetical protein
MTQTNPSVTKPILVVLSVLIPLIGYILFFVKKDEAPAAANTYLWSAIGGSITGLIINFMI